MLSCLEISRKNLLHNIRALKSVAGPEKKAIAVVKANAYGAGMNEVVSVLEPETEAFAIDDIEELRTLRQLTEKDIYVLGYIAHDDLEEAARLKGICVVYDEETVRALDEVASAVGTIADINLKVDALLGRQGVHVGEVRALVEVISRCKNLRLRGLYAHFANIEDTADFSHAQKQIDTFNEACELAGNPPERHISSTSGLLVYDKNSTNNTHVRLGIGLYGLWPSEGVRERAGENFTLKPVIRWVSHIAQVKTIAADTPIGYGLTYTTQHETRIAIIPQGYSDGFDRKLSNSGEVLIQGSRCPILGRVAMNMFVVDITHVPDAHREDEVVLLGKQGKEEITAEELADKIGSINYEIIARLSPLLPRTVV